MTTHSLYPKAPVSVNLLDLPVEILSNIFHQYFSSFSIEYRGMRHLGIERHGYCDLSILLSCRYIYKIAAPLTDSIHVFCDFSRDISDSNWQQWLSNRFRAGRERCIDVVITQEILAWFPRFNWQIKLPCLKRLVYYLLSNHATKVDPPPGMSEEEVIPWKAAARNERVRTAVTADAQSHMRQMSAIFPRSDILTQIWIKQSYQIRYDGSEDSAAFMVFPVLSKTEEICANLCHFRRSPSGSMKKPIIREQPCRQTRGGQKFTIGV